jgi:hypothetical protein
MDVRAVGGDLPVFSLRAAEASGLCFSIASLYRRLFLADGKQLIAQRLIFHFGSLFFAQSPIRRLFLPGTAMELSASQKFEWFRGTVLTISSSALQWRVEVLENAADTLFKMQKKCGRGLYFQDGRRENHQ